MKRGRPVDTLKYNEIEPAFMAFAWLAFIENVRVNEAKKRVADILEVEIRTIYRWFEPPFTEPPYPSHVRTMAIHRYVNNLVNMKLKQSIDYKQKPALLGGPITQPT